jgi:hypothetical protein
MADVNKPKVKVYKTDDADSNEVVGNKRAAPMLLTILGIGLVIILAIVLLVNLMRS